MHQKNYASRDSVATHVTASAADHLGSLRASAKGPGVMTAVVGIFCVLAVCGLLGLLFSFG
jgi:hypothetical protein